MKDKVSALDKSDFSGSGKDLKVIWNITASTNFEKMHFVREGIKKHYLVALKQFLNIDYDHLSAILGTTKATLHKKQPDEVFGPAITEKAVALAGIYRYGYEVFEDQQLFNKWMQVPNRALGDQIPLDVMDSIYGLQEVMNVIGRIEHGVHS